MQSESRKLGAAAVSASQHLIMVCRKPLARLWFLLLQLSDRMFRTRLHVIGEYSKDEGVYEITMVQRLGGRYDGYCEWTAADWAVVCAA
jgi:hypothetical protein